MNEVQVHGVKVGQEIAGVWRCELPFNNLVSSTVDGFCSPDLKWL